MRKETILNRSQRGFSLITVLVIMLVGTAMIGAAVYLHGGFARRNVASVSNIEDENLMDEGIERGKVLLLNAIGLRDGSPFIPRGAYLGSPPRSIDLPGDLLAYDRNGAPMELHDTRMSARGKEVKLTVEIFDTEYNSSQIKGNISPAKLRQLPPALHASENKYRMYLIRSTLTREPDTERSVTEVAMKARVLL